MLYECYMMNKYMTVITIMFVFISNKNPNKENFLLCIIKMTLTDDDNKRLNNSWRSWDIDDNLRRTSTYYFLNEGCTDETFETKKDLCNFIKYCEYMMCCCSSDPRPIAEDDCRDYFRPLYKYIDMLYVQVARLCS